MKNPLLLVMTTLATGLIWAGCASSASVPRVAYPVTYNVQVGNTQVATDDGGQNLNVAATQQVDVEPGEPLYYRVDAPIDVTVSVYEVTAGGSRDLLGQMRGTNFTTSIMPTSSMVEFSFSATQPNSNGLMQFTLSDEPIPAVSSIGE